MNSWPVCGTHALVFVVGFFFIVIRIWVSDISSIHPNGLQCMAIVRFNLGIAQITPTSASILMDSIGNEFFSLRRIDKCNIPKTIQYSVRLCPLKLLHTSPAPQIDRNPLILSRKCCAVCWTEIWERVVSNVIHTYTNYTKMAKMKANIEGYKKKMSLSFSHSTWFNTLSRWLIFELVLIKQS